MNSRPDTGPQAAAEQPPGSAQMLTALVRLRGSLQEPV